MNKDPPYWNEDRTSRRLVGVGWAEPKKFPGLVEDELICAMDESDVSLKAMSFTIKNSPAESLRNHKTDKLFSAASSSNKSNEITAAYVVHQILSKIYKNDVSKIYLMIPMTLVPILLLAASLFGILEFFLSSKLKRDSEIAFGFHLAIASYLGLVNFYPILPLI